MVIYLYSNNAGQFLMKNIITIILLLSVFSGVYFKAGALTLKDKSQTEEQKIEKIVNYPDSLFKKALINILKKNNATNTDQLLYELEIVKKGYVPEPEHDSGLSNINSSYNGKYTGWDVALGGTLIVFLGLVLIAVVVYLFNLILKELPERKAKGSDVYEAPSVIIGSGPKEDVPEDHLVAISAAIELYYRLYMEKSVSGITFSNAESSNWRTGNKFGVRQTQRK